MSGDRNEVDIEINDLLDDVDQSIAKALAVKNLPEIILKLSPAELND
ncbi:MAG TPA: hypothetical protein VGA27_07710 [Candidatus Binatia bacterium]